VALQGERTYNLPFDVNVSAFFNARQGYPEEFAIKTPRGQRRPARRCILLIR